MVPTRALLGLLPMSALVVLPVIASKRVLAKLTKETLRTRDPIPPSEETVLVDAFPWSLEERMGRSVISKRQCLLLTWVTCTIVFGRSLTTVLDDLG